MNNTLQNIEKHCVINGWQDHSNGLWQTKLKDTTPTVNSMLKTTTIGEQMHFHHEAVGSPVPSTWINAINQCFFITWPGLTATNVRKYLPKSRATSQGHLEQKWQNIASTKSKQNKTTDEENIIEVPKQEENNTKTNA
eukprot:8474229-Ditylum_brightwellii.AAC.1